jgi:hypothetical protein
MCPSLFDIRLMIERAAEHVLETGKIAWFIDDTQSSMAGMRQAMVNDDYGDYETFVPMIAIRTSRSLNCT